MSAAQQRRPVPALAWFAGSIGALLVAAFVVGLI